MLMPFKHNLAMKGLMVALIMFSTMLINAQGYAQSTEGYSKTIKALQERYADEVMAHRKYMAYSKQACKENYRNIAHLFKSLAASEGIHGRNFKKILSNLGAKPDPSLISDKISAGETSHNLKHAANVERDEIDHEYPDILKSIRPEKHEEAMTSIKYAWEAEKQHRDLIVKLEKAAIKWFGTIVFRIEGEDSHYAVCQVCGSTLQKIPEKKCPICGNDTSHYKSVPHWPIKACPRYDEDEGD